LSQIDGVYTSKTAALQHALLNNVLSVANYTKGGYSRALNRARQVLGDDFLKGSSRGSRSSGAGAGSGSASSSEQKAPSLDAGDAEGELSGEDADADPEEETWLTDEEEAAVKEAVQRMTDPAEVEAMNKEAKVLLTEYMEGIPVQSSREAFQPCGSMESSLAALLVFVRVL
jgi:hypothetical protein